MNDERLARRAAAGDRKAFEAIFRRYHQDLYRFCLATVGNPQDAQDALQNTMVKALRALPGEQREVKLKPWLYRIARNESMEVLRRRRDAAELEPEHPARTPEVAETAAARERLRGLLTDLEELPERQRSTLTMRELAGLGFAEIGEALGTSAAVARQTLYEARLSLRQMEAGREMDCDAVTQALSNADGRVTRRRDIRAHLRGCAECRGFRDAMAERRDDFASIAPLPVAVSGALLHGLLGAQAAASSGAAAGAAGASAAAGSAGGIGAGSVAGTIGAGAGKAVATSALLKSAATIAVVAVVGASAADRGGVIDLPPNGGTTEERGTTSPGASPSSDVRAAPEGAVRPASAGNGSARGNRQPAGAQPKAKGLADPEHAARAAGRGPAEAGRPAHAGRPDPAAGSPRGNSGQGKSQAARRGPPESLPAAASHGQQTAATHKSPRAHRPRGSGGESSGRTATPKPAQPPKNERATAPPAAPPPEPVEPSSPGKSGSAPKGAEVPPEAVSP